MNDRQKAVDIFLAGVDSVKPDNLINRYVNISNNVLKIKELTFNLSALGSIYIVGAGKASAAMAEAVENILGARISAGHIVTKYGHSLPLRYTGITEAGHPVPDENGVRGTARILSIVNKAQKDDLVICLISGGGSALLADVPDGSTLEDLKTLNSILLRTGADIGEMNCIRKHLSRVKGGHLANAAFPARVISLILSDVIGDPLDVIASGPTAPDPTTFADALAILSKYEIENELPAQILNVLYEGFENKRQETLKATDEMFQHIDNLIIGTNLLALKTAKEKAALMGYDTFVITNELAGEVNDAAAFIIEKIIKAVDEKSDKKRCLLFAGEPTVKINGSGKGGRNQHLALIVARLLKDMPGVTFLSGGTDGTDGPTDATGAVVDFFTSKNSLDLNLDMEKFLKDFDSYNFFKHEGGLVITGPTQTNVMDLMVALID
jgi:glycerate 2-kinase